MAVVYLHGNSSCRVDATCTGVLETVGPLGAALVAFDFAGSGLSDGEYVTLGWVSLAAQIWIFWPAILMICSIQLSYYIWVLFSFCFLMQHEQHDVATVMKYLIQKRGFKRVALWGRSMGAVSALLFAQSSLYQTIRPTTLVLDSPFCSFPRLVDDLIKGGAIRVPRLAVRTVLSMVRSSVRKRTGADIYKLEPIRDCGTSTMPALFVTADRDEMIPNEHGASLNNMWGGPSMQVTFHGGHNTPRPPHIYDGTSLANIMLSYCFYLTTIPHVTHFLKWHNYSLSKSHCQCYLLTAAGTFLRAVLSGDGSSSGKSSSGVAAETLGPNAANSGPDSAAQSLQFEPRSVQDAFASIKLMCEKAPSDLPPGWESATDPER